MVAGPDAARGEHVREPGRARVVELGEREPPVAAHERLVVGHGVGDALQQIGEVELHRRGPVAARPRLGRTVVRRRVDPQRGVDRRVTPSAAQASRACGVAGRVGGVGRRPRARVSTGASTRPHRRERVGVGLDAVAQPGEPLPLRGIAEDVGHRGREDRDVHARARIAEARPRRAAARRRGARRSSTRSSAW